MSITLPSGIELPQEHPLASLLGGLGAGIQAGVPMGLQQMLQHTLQQQQQQKQIQQGKQKLIPFFNQQLTKLQLDKKLDPDILRNYQDRAMEIFEQTGDYVGATNQALDELISKKQEPSAIGNIFKEAFKRTGGVLGALSGIPALSPREEVIEEKETIKPVTQKGTKQLTKEMAAEFWKKAPGKTRSQKEKNAIKMAQDAGYNIS